MDISGVLKYCSQLCCYVASQQVSDTWRAFLLLSLCIQLTSWTLVIYWSRHHWHNHPISRALQAHVQPPHAGWGSVASSINTEFRRIDKFSTGAPGARVFVTDSWVLKVSSTLICSQTTARGRCAGRHLYFYLYVGFYNCTYSWPAGFIQMQFLMQTLDVISTTCVDCLIPSRKSISCGRNCVDLQL